MTIVAGVAQEPGFKPSSWRLSGSPFLLLLTLSFYFWGWAMCWRPAWGGFSSWYEDCMRIIWWWHDDDMMVIWGRCDVINTMTAGARRRLLLACSGLASTACSHTRCCCHRGHLSHGKQHAVHGRGHGGGHGYGHTYDGKARTHLVLVLTQWHTFLAVSDSINCDCSNDDSFGQKMLMTWWWGLWWWWRKSNDKIFNTLPLRLVEIK